jgi:hypothetical protein
VLDIHGGDVVGQERNFIAEEVVGVLLTQSAAGCSGDVLDDVDNEVASANAGIKNFDARLLPNSRFKTSSTLATMNSTISCGV